LEFNTETSHEWNTTLREYMFSQLEGYLEMRMHKIVEQKRAPLELSDLPLLKSPDEQELRILYDGND